jgi:2-phospho-L-lactate guanylyltransferase
VRAAPIELLYVVTADPAVSACAEECGAVVLREPEARGHTDAVARAQAAALEDRAELFITVPGDVPCVTPMEVDALVGAAHRPRSAVFVPSRSGYGTNGVALRPPGLLPLKFGEPSFQNHLATARASGLSPVVLTLPGLALDIDTEADLRALAAWERGTGARRLLGMWGHATRPGGER